MYCLHGDEICPQGQIIYSKFDSVIKCGDIIIPVLAAYNTQDGIPRAVAPRSCPMRKREPETVVRIIETEPSIAAKWGPKKKSNKRQFSNAQVIEIRKRAKNGEPQRKIAADYGTSPTVISGICTGRNYKDVI
jgi:hypothetical protein